MSKWRPTNKSALYVIPDIHGMYSELQLILNRILPLRKSDGGKDMLVFLGDYIDRRVDSPKVLDLIIEVKNDHPDQVVCLRGNHEMLFEKAIQPNAELNDYLLWMQDGNGGQETLIGYLSRLGTKIENPHLFPRQRIIQIIPNEHIEFIKNLVPYYETDKYRFVHAGCDPLSPLDKQDPYMLAWDRTVFDHMKKLNMKSRQSWEKTIVCGHSGGPGLPKLVMDKYIMVDGSYSDMLYIYELNSGEAFFAKTGNKRLVQDNVRLPYVL